MNLPSHQNILSVAGHSLGGLLRRRMIPKKLTLTDLRLKDFMENRKNWRPPSYGQIMKRFGWKSKNSVSKALKRIKW